ncbi:hypothetical protein GGR52DRAFT_583291 [Hypoxylon sp. FL1284]|nr:hypothetical protein GGR52DRAFT_583291 [Hypoxylon sp. FL1284]
MAPKYLQGCCTEPPLASFQRDDARRRFYRIVKHFEDKMYESDEDTPYNRPGLIRLTYEYALSDRSGDHLLRAFFRAMSLPLENDGRRIVIDKLRPRVYGFADELVDNFFVPMKLESGESSYRRLVSAYPIGPRPLNIPLNMVHILPRSLARVNAGFRLDPANETALTVLNMLDHGLPQLIEGTNIDRPCNVFNFGEGLSELFCNFSVFLEPFRRIPHSYLLKSFLFASTWRIVTLPPHPTVGFIRCSTTEPPSLRLVAVHRAISIILHLSEADMYVDKLLKGLKVKEISGDGSTDLERALKFRLGS